MTKKPPRSPFQFGLSALLVLMVFAALLMGAVAGILGVGRSGMPPAVHWLMLLILPTAAIVVLGLIADWRRWRK